MADNQGQGQGQGKQAQQSQQAQQVQLRPIVGEKTADDTRDFDRLEEVALELFASSVAGGAHISMMKQVATRCFQAADVFLKLSEGVRSGDVAIQPIVKTGPQLQNCCAPKLPKTHPINLVSQQYGDLQKVNRIHNRLKEMFPGGDLSSIESPNEPIFQEEGVSWTKPEVATALATFPHYVSSN